MVTSPFSLTLNESNQLVEHAVVNKNYYCNLLNLPTKPIVGQIPLNQVQNNGRNLNNVYIDVLGVLRGCGTPRSINTATGDSFQVLQIEIFDITASILTISLWDPDNILRAGTWIPRYTVLFFTDVKLEWSDFEKAFRAKCTSRTVITENPPCRETVYLLNYAKDAPIETFDIVDKMLATLPEVNQIQEIMSINQIQNRIDSIIQGITMDKQFSALVYAYITNMDLDGLNKPTFAKCIICRQNVSQDLECDNSECSAFMDKEKTQPQVVFDMKINISDHTGTLYFCHFREIAVENTFGFTVEDFLLKTTKDKYELKWQYILELCAVRIFVVVNRGKPLISIVAINKEDTLQLAQKVPVF